MENEKKDKKSILKEAMVDYNEILKAAEDSAKKKLSEEFPDKFSDFIKEEVNKNKKNTSEKEPYKEVGKVEESENSDKTDENKKIVMENKNKKNAKEVNEQKTKRVKPTEKVAKKSKINEEEFDISSLDIDDIDSAIEAANEGDEFLAVDEIEAEISEMEKLQQEADMEVAHDKSPSYAKGEEHSPYDQLVNLKNQIQEVIKTMEVTEQKEQGGKQNYKGRENGGPTKEMIDEEGDDDVYEQKRQGGKQNYKGRENGGPTKEMIDEKDAELYAAERGEEGEFEDAEKMGDIEFSDADIEAALAEAGAEGFTPEVDLDAPAEEPVEEPVEEPLEAKLSQLKAIVDDLVGGETAEEPVEELPAEEVPEVEEGLGISHAKRKLASGDQLPRKDHLPTSHEPQLRSARQNENAKKLKALIEDNKKLSKKVNEVKKQKDATTTLLESYKSALGKYREQLKEMAVFNTNLAHVNNILVNEELALTQDDKIKVIKEFKQIDSLNESQKKYNQLLTEMKGGRKNFNVEGKLNKSVHTSSKKKLDEVVEKTAYENNDHIKKMKRLIEYVEGRGRK